MTTLWEAQICCSKRQSVANIFFQKTVSCKYIVQKDSLPQIYCSSREFLANTSIVPEESLLLMYCSRGQSLLEIPRSEAGQCYIVKVSNYPEINLNYSNSPYHSYVMIKSELYCITCKLYM
jgi:hypothetical protein